MIGSRKLNFIDLGKVQPIHLVLGRMKVQSKELSLLLCLGWGNRVMLYNVSEVCFLFLEVVMENHSNLFRNSVLTRTASR